MALLSTGDNLNKLTGDERLGQNRNSEYLGAEDIDPGTEPILTIEALWNGNVTLQKGKENKDVITFVEKTVHGIKNVRPLIVNATNRKALKKGYGGTQAKHLVNKKIQLYVDHKVRDPQDGSLTDGIRIKPKEPVVRSAIKCESCEKEIMSAHGMTPEEVAAYTKKSYGETLCAACGAKAKQAAAKQSEPTEPVESAKNVEGESTDENVAN